jgi:hypothetical protein
LAAQIVDLGCRILHLADKISPLAGRNLHLAGGTFHLAIVKIQLPSAITGFGRVKSAIAISAAGRGILLAAGLRFA